MLRLQLHQFRCWSDLVIEAPLGAITLIKGPSGIGKTTLLQAITWCLYGTLQKVAPNNVDTNKSKTRVELTFPYQRCGVDGLLSITRQKNPNRLQLNHPGTGPQEDAVAQSIIDEMFGSVEIWMASCYIGQGTRNNFLTAPKAGKIELLNKIAFHEEDPAVYIDRIETEITATTALYTHQLNLFTTALDRNRDTLETLDPRLALSPEDLIQCQSDLSRLEEEEAHWLQIKTKRAIALGTMENLKKRLNHARENLPDASMLLQENERADTELKPQISEWEHVLPLLRSRDRMRSAMPSPKVQIDLTLHLYGEVLALENLIRINQDAARRLKVPYDMVQIEAILAQHERTLSGQRRSRVEYDLQMVTREIKETQGKRVLREFVRPDATPREINPPDYEAYSTEQLSLRRAQLACKQGGIYVQLEQLKIGLDVLECPKCHGNVRYDNGCLQSAEVPPTTPAQIQALEKDYADISHAVDTLHDRILRLTEAKAAAQHTYEKECHVEKLRLDGIHAQIKRLELEEQRHQLEQEQIEFRIQELITKRDILQQQLNALPPNSAGVKLLTETEIATLQRVMVEIRSIEVRAPPVHSSADIRTFMDYEAAKEQYEAHVALIPNPYRHTSVSHAETTLKQIINEYNTIKTRGVSAGTQIHIIRTLEHELETLESTVDPDPEVNLNDIATQRIALKHKLDQSAHTHAALQCRVEITRQREDLVALNDKLSDLHQLKQHAVETECRILQQIGDQINASIEDVCGTLFDHDILIVLKTFRTLKTTKHIRPEVNFTISYKGGVYDNISELSGGEGDRASIALTLALNRLSSCPLLILDESMAFLDADMKDATIATIRENTSNTVLIIMHEGTEGIFDHVIDCETFRYTG